MIVKDFKEVFKIRAIVFCQLESIKQGAFDIIAMRESSK